MSRKSQRVPMIWPSGKPSHQREGQSLQGSVGRWPAQQSCMQDAQRHRAICMKAELSDCTERKPLGMKRSAALYLKSCIVCMQAAELLAHDHEVGCMCGAINM